MVHPTFAAFMEAVVIPRRALDPSKARFDGWSPGSGGNREIAGRFRHQGKVWKMHADTRFEPLFKAYEEVKRMHKDPFVVTTTQRDRGTRLVLRDDLWTGFKYLYIYSG
jgi:hypothetical protein